MTKEAKSQIKPVGIPAGLDGWIGRCAAIGVTGASGTQQVEVLVGQIEQLASPLPCQVRSSLAVAVVDSFIDTPGIVEEGEELHHLDVRTRRRGEPKPVL